MKNLNYIIKCGCALALSLAFPLQAKAADDLAYCMMARDSHAIIEAELRQTISEAESKGEFPIVVKMDTMLKEAAEDYVKALAADDQLINRGMQEVSKMYGEQLKEANDSLEGDALDKKLAELKTIYERSMVSASRLVLKELSKSPVYSDSINLSPAQVRDTLASGRPASYIEISTTLKIDEDSMKAEIKFCLDPTVLDIEATSDSECVNAHRIVNDEQYRRDLLLAKILPQSGESRFDSVVELKVWEEIYGKKNPVTPTGLQGSPGFTQESNEQLDSYRKQQALLESDRAALAAHQRIEMPEECKVALGIGQMADDAVAIMTESPYWSTYINHKYKGGHDNGPTSVMRLYKKVNASGG